MLRPTRSLRLLVGVVTVATTAVLAPAAQAQPTATATTAATATTTATATHAPYPSSMSSLGDSITRAFDAYGWFVDWPTLSWSTGTDSSVNSHYARIKAVNPGITGHNHNDARTGAKVAELDGQAATAAGRGVEYVTILIGANDACTSSEAAMTPVETFRAEFAEAMSVLAAKVPSARILVVSIPDIRRLWAVGRTSPSAVATWSAFGICQSMLKNPTSYEHADVTRRARVRQRVVDYNTQLAEVCAAYLTCRFDGNAVFNYRFRLSHLSPWDYFHPNVSGQAVLASVSNAAGYRW